MRWLDRAGRARSYRRDRKPLEVERDHQGLSFDVVEVNVGCGGNARSALPVHSNIIQLGQNLRLQAVAELAQPGNTPVSETSPRNLGGLAQRHDPSDILGSRPALPLVISSIEQRLDQRSLP